MKLCPVLQLNLAGAILCLCIATLTGCAANGPATDASEATGPKETAVAFADAVAAGNMRAVHQLASGTAAQFEAVKSVSDSVRALQRLDTALTQKFGDSAGLPRQMMMFDLAAEVAAADVKIDGNTALLIYKNQPPGAGSPRLKRSDNRWKMDLSYMTEDPIQDDMQSRMTQHLNQVAADINDGKYSTLDEAMEAVRNVPRRGLTQDNPNFAK